jgi:hypothetical protein
MTSNLASLKLSIDNRDKSRYSLSQVSQILQHHRNFEELELKHGTLPAVERSGTPVPIVLPQLVDLRLNGAKGPVLQFVDLIDMSSPLHNAPYIFAIPTVYLFRVSLAL